MSLKFLVTACVLFFGISLSAQVSLSGTIREVGDSSVIVGAGVQLFHLPDSASVRNDITDVSGNFSFTAVPAGSYLISISFIGYQNLLRPMELGFNKSVNRTFYLNASNQLLEGVDIVGKNNPVQTRNDTTEMKSAAFKVNPDATAEDLVTKMPGIRMENGKVTAQGEEVKKVLVDGKPFFGKDPAATLRNLPANAVDRVQVFDAMSDQAQFTGVDDGNSEKTINIIFKPDRRTGNFGRLFGGVANDGKYTAGGVFNTFDKDRKFTILAQSNDINEQNFSSQDMAAMQTQSGGGHGGRGGGFGGSNPLMSNSQNGVMKTHALGVNFINSWAKKVSLSGSAFGNITDNNLLTSTFRQYYIINQQYNENYSSSNKANTARGNVRLEYKIDSSQQIFYTGAISYGTIDLRANTLGFLNDINSLISKNVIENTNTGNNLNTNNDLNYMKRLNTLGRSVFLELSQNYSNNLPLVYQNQFTDFGDSAAVNNQLIDIKNYNRSYGGEVTYTEPIDSFNSIGVNYELNYKMNDINKEAYQLDGSDPSQTQTLIRNLTNITNNTYTSHLARMYYRFNKKQLRFSLGGGYQYSILNADQTYPVVANINKTFKNFLPEAWMRWSKTRTESLGFFFRGRTQEPGISQLQNVIDNSNYLKITTGNPDLKQSTRYMLFMRYNKSNNRNYTSFGFSARNFFIQDYISNRIISSDRDTMISGYGILPRGSQFSYPVNLNGYQSLGGSADYSFPMSLVKSNISLNVSVGYTKAPSMLNDVINNSRTTNVGFGITISSNFSQNVDFTLFSRPKYNVVKNDFSSIGNNEYFSMLNGAKFNFIFFKNWVLNSDVSHYYNGGLSGDLKNNYVLWNAGVGYKFLKDNAAEVRLTAFDLLKNNDSISTTYADNYREDLSSNVLTRYFMLMLSYKF
ncbi:MAG TPA: outer membrane beta-barrel protein [Saprospiraceae bacterium]|nr:outer membrane beta-barrel protein [Saprospiraceae bacterium]HQW56633.1 outer membrane beta-barrel protein [Saprospiraceae bacterium]